MFAERSEHGSALVISMALLLLLVVLGASLLALSGVENNISHNDLWSEGALQAAEAGTYTGIEQLQFDREAAVQPVAETPIGEDYSFRSGGRLAPTAEPLTFLGHQREAGFGIGVGTGYNPSGYAFARYRINATGIGPRNTRREVEALASYGPVPE
jgi:hypothetical protein